MSTYFLLNLGGAAMHIHRDHYDPDIRASRCSCGINQFPTRFGVAEYNPSANITVMARSRKQVWPEEEI